MDLTVRTIRVQNQLINKLCSLLKLFCIVVSEYTQGDAYLCSMIIEVLLNWLARLFIPKMHH